jgi:formate-dependent nitrite reductase cytochrome c552 subunit
MFTIHVHHHFHSEDDDIQKLILKNLQIIMGKLEDLDQKVNELQSTVDDVQEKIATRLAADDAIIAELKAKLEAGAGITNDELQSVIDKVEAARADLAATSTESTGG